MQSQMIGMQSSLDRILSAVQQNQAASAGPGMYGNGSREYHRSRFKHNSLSYADGYAPPTGDGPSSRPRFPPLPGFAPPVRDANGLLVSATHIRPL